MKLTEAECEAIREAVIHRGGDLRSLADELNLPYHAVVAYRNQVRREIRAASDKPSYDKHRNRI